MASEMASDKDKTIFFQETSADGSTQNFTVNTNGGNFVRVVKGNVIEGDYYEGGKKAKKPTT